VDRIKLWTISRNVLYSNDNIFIGDEAIYSIKSEEASMVKTDSVRYLRNSMMLLVLFVFMILAGCGGGSGDTAVIGEVSYKTAIQEGRTAANELLEQTGASSISVVFWARGQVIWAETFGFAEKETAKPPTTETMYGIGSVSKMIATIAAMILVDQGNVDLDAPVTTYVPDFSMLSPEYTRVTVRMLLNHSSGFPGTDDRNAFTSSPVYRYADQLVGSLQNERLKHAPGFMQTYCNDGFTLIEKVIENVSGMTYAGFVQENIFNPLGMLHSAYPLYYYADDIYAHTYADDQKNPQLFVNLYGSGGLNSTPSDMIKIAAMFINGGVVGKTRILSQEAVDEMAMDQTLGTFNPVVFEGFRYGLGWDTVTQPGLKAVGVKAWSKGGDTGYYGAALVVAPEVDMAVMVTGASNFTSGHATTMAEKILLRALAEEGRTPSFPQPLPATPKPAAKPSPADLNAISGFFASPTSIYKIEPNPDDSIILFEFVNGNWKTKDNLNMRSNGLFSSDEHPLREFYSITARNRHYLVVRQTSGNRHYQDDTIVAEKISPGGVLTDAWKNRLDREWLVVNSNPDSVDFKGGDRFTISELDDLPGLICALPDQNSYHMLDPSQSDVRGSMMLFLPQSGRDQNDLFIVDHNGEEWLRFGSFVYRPLETVSALAGPITIGNDGYAEWRRLAGDQMEKTITTTSGSAWRIFDPDFNLLVANSSTGSATLPATSGDYHLMLFGEPGDLIRVDVTINP
jgi:CubicO group peptidase (beta-lactamase class C family)